jgi:DNA-binding Xre family transcriptional regulator
MTVKLVLKFEEFCKAREITQRELAKVAGIREPALSEMKKRSAWNVAHLEKIMNAYGVTDVRELIDAVEV